MLASRQNTTGEQKNCEEFCNTGESKVLWSIEENILIYSDWRQGENFTHTPPKKDKITSFVALEDE